MDNEEAAYKGLIAESSSDDGNDELNENESGDENAAQKRIEEMRMKLLGGITADNEDKHKKRGSVMKMEDQSDDEIGDSEREELEVNFGVGFGEDIGKKLIQKKQEKKEKENMTEFQKYQEKRKERRREKKQSQKEKVKLAKQQGRMSEKEVEKMTKEQQRQRAELDLLIDDSSKTATFDKESSKRDLRFVKDLDNEFAVDPTHKDYRKVTQGHNKISSNKRKKHK